jgi:hypothetical protein
MVMRWGGLMVNIPNGSEILSDALAGLHADMVRRVGEQGIRGKIPAGAFRDRARVCDRSLSVRAWCSVTGVLDRLDVEVTVSHGGVNLRCSGRS